MKPSQKKPDALPDRATLDAAYEEYSKHKQAEILAPWNRLVAWCEMHNVTTYYAQFQPINSDNNEGYKAPRTRSEIWSACTKIRHLLSGSKDFFPEGYFPLPRDSYLAEIYPSNYEVLIKMALPWPDEIQIQPQKKFPGFWEAYFALRDKHFSIEEPAKVSDAQGLRNCGLVAIQKLISIGIIEREHADKPDGFHLLSAHARNAIPKIVHDHRETAYNDGKSTKSLGNPITIKCVSDAIKSRSFVKKIDRYGIGRKTLDEIREWVGLKLLPPKPTSEIAALKKAWQLTPSSARASVLAKIKRIDALAAKKLALIKPE